MESGTLPPPPMLLHSNDSFPPMSSSHSPMNQYSDIFSSKHSANTNTKTTKRKFDDIIDPAAGEFDSAGSALKPQKTDQQNVDPERSLSRTGTPLSNGSLPAPSSALSRNDNDNGPPSYEFSASNNNVNTGRTTPNSSLLSQPTPPPPPSLQQQQQPPPLPQQQGPPSAQPQQSMPPQQQPTMPPLPPSSSYMPMSPRNQYNLTSDSPFLQTNNQVFVFTTHLANEAAEAVMKNEYPNIVEYHKSLPNTAQFLSVSPQILERSIRVDQCGLEYFQSISNNMNPNHNPMMGGMMHPNQGPPPPGCHSPRTMQMMMNGAPPPHHNPHLVHHNGNGGPPPNWPHPHFHPHQQQPSFGRLTPGSGGLPPPGHLLPPGAMMMNGSSPPPGMRGMPPMPGMGPMPSDSTENLTPDQVKRRKNQLNKIEDLKTKITGGRARGGRAKANAAAMATPPGGGIPPPVNGLPPPPGALDPHQQQMMMMNSPHGVGPPHHMMGMVPPPPHMLPPGMRGPPDGMMMEMNGPPPPHGYMNGPMPPGYHGQYGPGPGPNDPYGQMLPPHQQHQAMRDWNKMQLDHLEGKGPMRGQPPPYSSVSPSSLTPPIATTSAGGGPNSNLNSGKLLSPKMEPSGAPRLYKVGQPEKFIPDALPSANKKLPGAIGEAQMTSSPSQMDYNDLGMDGEELLITRHLNQAYRSNNNGTGNTGQPLPSSSSSSSSCKDEPMTPSQRSTSTPNHIANTLSSGKPPAGSTTPTHLSQGPPSHLSSQNVSVASPRSSKLNTNSSLASPLMLGNPNSASKDDPLDMNGGPRTPTSNMAPPLSSMLQMTNSLQSAGSPYNPSNNSSMGGGLKSSSSMSGNGPPMVSPNLGHMSKSMDQLPPSSHMPLPPPHPQMQFQNMNPHHRMLGPHEPMPPHFNPPGGNFGPPPPGHPHMYKMRPPHHGMDPSGMMMLHPGGGPMRSSKGLPPPPSDHMQAHHLPPPHYQKMSNMDPHLGGPPPGHPQQHMRFGPMMDDGFNMGPPPPSHHPHHPHMHPHMHPHGPPMHHHHPMHPNDGRLPPPQGPPPPQAINNTYVSTTMSIQQLNIQSVGPGGGPADLHSGTIHYHAPPGNGLDCPPPPGGPPGSTSNSTMFSSQQQFTSMTHIPGHDPSYPPQFNDLQPLPPNLSMDGVQPSNYW